MKFSIGIHYLHSVTGVILENVKMSPERYCFPELEKGISLEMLALHKNILEREKIDFRSINR